MKHPDRTPGNRWLVLLLLLGLATLTQAAQVSVRTDRNPVAVDESFQIIFSVEGDASGTPDFSPLEKDFQVLGTSRSLRTTFINGKMRRANEYLVSVMPRRAGELTIPSIHFGGDASPPLKLRVLPASAAVPGGQTRAEVRVEAKVDTESPYVQQQVLLTVRIYHRIQWREASLSEPEFRGGEVLVQKLGDDRNFSVTRDGRQWNVIERRYALYPQASGRIEMDPLVLSMRVPSGERKARDRSPFGDPFFDDFFSRQTYVRKVVRSNGLKLEVRPVPATFTGQHWLPARKLELREEWSAPLDALKTGEPVTRTLTLVAEGVSLGQLPELTMPEIPGLRIYPDEPQTSELPTADGVRSVLTRKFAIIPVRAGTLDLPPLELAWWDVQRDEQQVARLPAHRLEVSGAAAAPSPPPAGVKPQAGPEPEAVPSSRLGQRLQPLLDQLPMVRRISADPVDWLIAGNLLFLALWLLTLVAWLRARKGRGEGRKNRSEIREQEIDAGPLWQALRVAARRGDAAQMRDAVLALAPVLWPERPPRSLEAVAGRVDGPLREELLRLSRALYAGGSEAWDATLIEKGLRAIRPDAGQGSKVEPQALRPLYPGA